MVSLPLYGGNPHTIARKVSTTSGYQLQEATKIFDESQILGVGGFGKVYEGEIDGGGLKVVVKIGNPL